MVFQQLLVVRLFRTGKDVLGRGNRLNSAGHDLTSALAAAVVRELGLKQLGVRENDAKLVVQAVKQSVEF